MYFLSLSFGLSIHSSVNSWPNHFKISKVVVHKRTSVCRSVTSSIYLNWNISVIYCRIEIKLVSVFVSLILRSIESQFGHRGQGSPWYHMKYYGMLKVILTFGVNGKVNAYFFLSLGLSVHNFVNYWPNNFKLSTIIVDKGTSGWIGITPSLYLNWHISVIYCRI